jgi:hypothetical protein
MNHFSKTIYSFKVNDKQRELLNQAYMALDPAEPLAIKDFLLEILRRYLTLSENPATHELTSQKLMALEQENQQLKQALQTQPEPGPDNQEMIQELNQQIQELERENSRLSDLANANNDAGFSIIQLELQPIEIELLELICSQETRRTQQQITPDKLLLEMFLSYLARGTHDHFPIPQAQIAQIVKHHHSTLPNQDEI